MIIDNIKANLVVHPLPGEFHPAWGPGLTMKELLLTLIEITTDTGIKGYGALPANDKEGVVGVNTFIKDNLIGLDVFNIEEIEKVLRNSSLRMTWPWGVEMAIWDIIGKDANRPVYKLMGGFQDKIKVYASLGEVRSAEDRVKEAIQIKKAGFSGIKLRFHDNDPSNDIKIAREVVDAVGDSIEIMVDANQADALPGSKSVNQWDYYTALEVGKELEKMGIAWLEEPLPRFDIEGLKKLSSKLSIPIAGGEKNQMIAEFKQLIENDCYDILQGDASFSAGLFELRKVAGIAEAFHKKFVPHTWSNGIGLFANLQLAASLPNCPWFEYPYEEPGWGHRANNFLFKDKLKIQNGYIEVPQKPGLGFEIDSAKIEKYKIE
ncbi:MAG: mandelate racemase/muconate lactonizing enzyme family protein [Halanaerobiales bacterium]|nr:mandelate racemase/muconate lactonizing enzyme family protein [Halanaerobiales bacterium]